MIGVKMNDFINDLSGSTVAKSRLIIKKYSSYKKVLFRVGDHLYKWFVVGVGEHAQYSIEHYSNYNLLVSLFNLAKVFDDVKSNDDSFYLDEIISWCKKNGLPYIDHDLMKNYHKDEYGKLSKIIDSNDPTINPQTNEGFDGFALEDFKDKLYTLFCYINLWYSIAFDDYSKAVDYSLVLKRSMGLINTNDLIHDKAYYMSIIKYHFGISMSHFMETKISLQYDQKTDVFNIIPESDSLFSIGYYQLAILSINSGIKPIKICSVCGYLFEVEHASKKICINCRPEYQRLKMQESRKRKATHEKKAKGE